MKKMMMGIVAMMMVFGTMTANANNVAKNDKNGYNVTAVNNDGHKTHHNDGHNGNHNGNGNHNVNGNHNGNVNHNGNHNGNHNDGHFNNAPHNGGHFNDAPHNGGHFGNAHYDMHHMHFLGDVRGNDLFVRKCTGHKVKHVGHHNHVFLNEVVRGHHTGHVVCAVCGLHMHRY